LTTRGGEGGGVEASGNGDADRNEETLTELEYIVDYLNLGYVYGTKYV
jgi:hypothetical protein